METPKFFISATMRYDSRSHDLEKGDRIKVAAFDETTVMVARPKTINDFDKVFIKNELGLTDSITMSYVELKKGTNWKYID